MPAKKKSDPGLSIRAYAKERGCSDRAVRNAIKDGRLLKSIGKHAGQVRIIDPDLADREWAENTLHDRVPLHVLRKREELAGKKPLPHHARAAAGAAKARKAMAAAVAGGDELADMPSAKEGDTLLRADAIKKTWEAKWQELRVRERMGELVEHAAMTQRFADIAVNTRTKLLGIPNKFRQRVPTLKRKEIVLLENMIREALEELADDR
jgi:phage terminase Nu1 subunit (DNA packaging protein)